MRLLILAAQYFPVVGGSEVQTRLLARELKRQGNEVEVWTRRLAPGHLPRESVDAVTVRRLGFTLTPGARWARRLERAGFAFDLHREMRSEGARFDVVFANQPQFPALVALWARKWLKAPVVARSAASGPESEMRSGSASSRFQRHVLVRGLDCVVALGPATRDECLGAGFEPARVAVIPNGIEIRPAPRGSRGPAPALGVVWLGNLRKEKRADLAIRAWRESAIPGALTLIGDGEERGAIEALIAGSRDGGAVTLQGRLEDPRTELARAHVYLQSSDTEGMSNALLEAMAEGCACIATDVGETRFVLGGSDAGDIAEGSFVRAEAGLLVRPNDARGIAKALNALTVSTFREELAAAAEARCHTHHSIASAARRYEALFKGLLDSRRGSAS